MGNGHIKPLEKAEASSVPTRKELRQKHSSLRDSWETIQCYASSWGFRELGTILVRNGRSYSKASCFLQLLMLLPFLSCMSWEMEIQGLKGPHAVRRVLQVWMCPQLKCVSTSSCAQVIGKKRSLYTLGRRWQQDNTCQVYRLASFSKQYQSCTGWVFSNGCLPEVQISISLEGNPVLEQKSNSSKRGLQLHLFCKTICFFALGLNWNILEVAQDSRMRTGQSCLELDI